MPQLHPDGPETVRRFRRAIGMTQERLAEISCVSVRTIRTLERDPRAEPRQSSLDRVADALALNDSERGLLLSTWGYGELRRTRTFADLVGPDNRLDPMVRAVEERVAQAHTTAGLRSVQITDSDRVRRDEVRRVVQADQDEVRGVVLITETDGCPPDHISVTTQEGCAGWSSTFLPGIDILIIDVAFATALNRGDQHAYGLTIDYVCPPGFDHPPMTPVIGTGVNHPGSLCVVHVGFDGHPRRTAYVRGDLSSASLHEIGPIPCDDRNRAQIVVSDAAPGFHGIRWS
jgi:transcriptional regulator with XRE-family HTH domain